MSRYADAPPEVGGSSRRRSPAPRRESGRAVRARRSPGTWRTPIIWHHAIEHEAQIGRALHVDGIGKSRTKERRDAPERAFDDISLLTPCREREMNPRVAVIDRQNNGCNPHVHEGGIGHVILAVGGYAEDLSAEARDTVGVDEDRLSRRAAHELREGKGRWELGCGGPRRRRCVRACWGPRDGGYAAGGGARR